MNTHYVMVITSVPPKAEVIAHGEEDFVRDHLKQWVEAHPLGEYDSAEILEVVT